MPLHWNNVKSSLQSRFECKAHGKIQEIYRMSGMLACLWKTCTCMFRWFVNRIGQLPILYAVNDVIQLTTHGTYTPTYNVHSNRRSDCMLSLWAHAHILTHTNELSLMLNQLAAAAAMASTHLWFEQTSLPFTIHDMLLRVYVWRHCVELNCRLFYLPIYPFSSSLSFFVCAQCSFVSHVHTIFSEHWYNQCSTSMALSPNAFMVCIQQKFGISFHWHGTNERAFARIH